MTQMPKMFYELQLVEVFVSFVQSVKRHQRNRLGRRSVAIPGFACSDLRASPLKTITTTGQ